MFEQIFAAKNAKYARGFLVDNCQKTSSIEAANTAVETFKALLPQIRQLAQQYTSPSHSQHYSPI